MRKGDILMASNLEFVEYVCEQVAGAGEITYRKMFGEYGIYMDGKFVALICDDQFFVKPTSAGQMILGTPNEVPPFDGAKNCFLIEDLDNSELLTRLLIATWEELPFPKPKKAKK
jgi:TfoX/Sxy family transcriptional regulator of competence genes